jgi:predicted nucleic acid-binding Zn ribbon protein
MPVYTYRREDGTTFDYRQKFLDDPLTLDPETGQKVVRVVQAAGVIFKGSGFYVNDSKSASKSTSTPPKNESKDGAESKPSEGAPAEAKSAEAKPAPVAAPAAAD